MTEHLPFRAPDLDHVKLTEMLHYERMTGVFRWKISPSPNVKIGQEAGCMKEGYRLIRVMKHRFYAHRLAWFYVYKTWPARDIDHANTVFSDNRINNLRETTESQNMANSRLSKKNTSGFKGIVFDHRKGSWVARITKDRRKRYIGSFKTPEEAHAAYCAAAKATFGEFARSG